MTIIMNKSDLIAALAAKENFFEKNAKDVINLIFDPEFPEICNDGRR